MSMNTPRIKNPMANKSAMAIAATSLGPLLAFGFFKASQFIIVVLKKKNFVTVEYLEYLSNNLEWSRKLRKARQILGLQISFGSVITC